MLKPVADWDLPSLATALTATSLKAKLQSMRTGARGAGERDPTSARWRGRRRDFLSVMVAVNGGEGDRTTALNQHASLRHCRRISMPASAIAASAIATNTRGA